MDSWLSIIGMTEDGPDGLPPASRAALAQAEIVFGGPRHLAMADHPGGRAWPVPFSIAPVLALRGRRVAVLASGDPFWHGAGSVLAAALQPGEWRAYPAPSVMSLAAAHLGWALQDVLTLGLHAAPVSRLRLHLVPGLRAIVTLRDAAAVGDLAAWLTALGFGATTLWVMERLGGPSERIRQTRADTLACDDIGPLVVVALDIAGDGAVIPRSCGIADRFFDHDGQITKRPVRALALSALAPRAGELLWDIGAGSGSIGIEWLLSHPTTRCIGVEADATRAARARDNAANLGVDRLEMRHGAALDLLASLPDPQAVFIGGGADAALMDALWSRLSPGCRLVAHAVTLETEALLTDWHARAGGDLLRIDIASAVALGRKRGWRASFPVVQWAVSR